MKNSCLLELLYLKINHWSEEEYIKIILEYIHAAV